MVDEIFLKKFTAKIEGEVVNSIEESKEKTVSEHFALFRQQASDMDERMSNLSQAKNNKQRRK